MGGKEAVCAPNRTNSEAPHRDAAHRSDRCSVRQAGFRAREWCDPAVRLPMREAQWPMEPLRLAYRCGGSAGMMDANLAPRTGFPFTRAMDTRGYLKQVEGM